MLRLRKGKVNSNLTVVNGVSKYIHSLLGLRANQFFNQTFLRQAAQCYLFTKNQVDKITISLDKLSPNSRSIFSKFTEKVLLIKK